MPMSRPNTGGGGGGLGDMTKAVYDSNNDGKVASAAIADSATTADQLGGVAASSWATDAELSSHSGNTSNPHSVTAVQAGAVPTSYLDTDTALTADSDSKVATQKAVKAFSMPLSYLDTDATLAANSNVKVASQAAIKSFSLPASYLDLDGTLSSNSDVKVASVKAVKAYIDGSRTAQPARNACNFATTAALPACTYSNGTAGVGATLTGDANGALPTQDGVELVLGMRALVKSQASELQNGIYTITQIGDAGTPFILTRATDSDEVSGGEITNGAFCTILSGTVNANSIWQLVTSGTITIGTTAMTFAQLPAAAATTASNGVKMVANDAQVDLSDTNPSLEISDGGLRAKVDGSSITRTAARLTVGAGGITNAMLAGSIDLTTKVTGALPIANGGTGEATQQAAINALAGAVTNNRVLRANGTNITLAQVNLTSDVTGELPNANLAQVTTASKISGAAITSLASLPSGAGVIPIANLATGTPDGTKFVRDDGTLAVPPGSGGAGTGNGYAVSSLDWLEGAATTSWVVPTTEYPWKSSAAYATKRFDLSNVTAIRIVSFIGTASSGISLTLKYSTDNVTYNNIDDAGTNASVSLGAANAFYVSPWTTIKSAAQGDVYLRLFGQGGNGTTGRTFYMVHAEMRTAAGVVMATAAEVTTGTETAKAISPDALAGSVYGKRVVCLKVIAEGTTLTTGDGKMYFTIPSELHGYNLVDADAVVYTVSSSGTPTVMIHNLTDTQDILSTAITIDETEYASYNAATQPVINTSYDDVITGDRLRVDVDVAGTDTKGLDVFLTFQLP